MTFILGLKSGDQSGKLMDKIGNVMSLKLLAGWKAFKEGIGIDAIHCKPWICVNPSGKCFSSLKTAKDTLISPAATFPPAMAAADA